MPPPADAARPSSGRLRLEGTVAFTVTGVDGRTTGSARGDGSVLRVQADDPVAVWGSLAGSAGVGRAGSAGVGRAGSAGVGRAGAGALGRLADRLHAEGLAVEVSGPGGVLATVGAGADSALGRAVTGSRRVQPGSATALRPLVAAQLARVVGRRERSLLLAGLAVLVLVVRRRGAH